MANGISDMINSRLRMSGLSSGIDVDSMVQQLMKVEFMKVDKVKQDKTLLEWKRDDYRSITNILRGFSDDFFNSLKPSSNFRSANAISVFQLKSSSDSIVTATANSTAQTITHKIKVSNLAKAASIEGTNTFLDPVKGINTISRYDLKNKQIAVTLDGNTKVITLEDYSSDADLETKLEASLTSAFGTGKFDVVTTGSQVEFRTQLQGSTFSVADNANTFISELGFTDGRSNHIVGGNVSTDFSSYTDGKFNIKVGFGDPQTINVSSASDINDLTTKIQNAIDTNVNLAGKVAVSNDGTKLTFTSRTSDTIAFSMGDGNDILGKMGFINWSAINATSINDINLSNDEDGKTFNIKINDTDYTIEIDQDYSDINLMANYIQTQIRNLSSNNNINITATGNKLSFSSSGIDKVTINKGPENALSFMGFANSDNKSNRIVMNAKLADVKDIFSLPGGLTVPSPDENVALTINGVQIDVGKKYADTTLYDVMNAINSSDAGVQMTYDSLNNKFKLESKVTGVTSNISFTDTNPTNGLLKSLGIDIGNLQNGEDALFELDSVSGMKRSTNTFNIDGVTYTLKDDSQPATLVTIDVKPDLDNMVTNIKNFVNKYNEVIDKINKEYSEERFKDYLPLTDDQRSSMKDEDIKNWEEKAKSGLLKGDSIIYSITNNMRKALYEGVTDVNTSLTKIGITTNSYQEKGKLIIDETKLRDALTKDANAVVQLFTKDSQYSYNEALNDKGIKQIRYQESGLCERLYDIIQDNIRTTRDSNGTKGILLEKAGIEGDITEFRSTLVTEIYNKDNDIKSLIEKLTDKENRYYAKFTAMETALSKMNSQSSWLAQQLGQK